MEMVGKGHHTQMLQMGIECMHSSIDVTIKSSLEHIIYTPCAPIMLYYYNSMCSLLHRDRPVIFTISIRPVVRMRRKHMACAVL